MKALPEKATVQQDIVPTQPQILSTQPQLLFSLGEKHKLISDKENMIYLDKMAEILKKNEADAKQTVQLLVEVAPCLYSHDEYFNGDLLCGLPELVENLQLNKTTLENIEVRRLSELATNLFKYSLLDLKVMEAHTKEEESHKKALQLYGLPLEAITFKDAIGELEMLLSKAAGISNKWSSLLIKREFLEYETSAREYIESLKLILADFKIDAKSPMLKTSIDLCWEDQAKQAELENQKKVRQKQNQCENNPEPENEEIFRSKRNRLSCYFNDAAVNLFDLLLLDRVLELRKTPEKTIMIIAGRSHITSVTSSLMRGKAYGHVMTPYYAGTAANVLPLPADKLDLLLKPLDYFQEKSFYTYAVLIISSAFMQVVPVFCLKFATQAVASEPTKKSASY